MSISSGISSPTIEKTDDGSSAGTGTGYLTDPASSTPSKGVDLDIQDTINSYYCRARDRYRFKLKTLNQANLPILDNVFTKTSSNINSYRAVYAGSSYPLLYTPTSTASAWVDEVSIGGGKFQSDGEPHTEADYWTDPRFNSNCFKQLTGGGQSYMVFRKSDNHLWIAGKLGSGWLDLQDIGPRAKRIIILAVGAGGGGAGGVHITGTTLGGSDPYYSSGAGGGGGAGAMVVANVGEIDYSAYPYQNECLLIDIGAGGTAGQCVASGDTPSYIKETVWGGNGGDTVLSLYTDGSLRQTITCQGGKGGGNGTKCRVFVNSWVDYPMPYGGGAGGAVEGYTSSHFWFVRTNMSNPPWFCIDGGAGGESRYYTTITKGTSTSATEWVGNGSGSEKDGGVAGSVYGLLKGTEYIPSGAVTTAVSYYAPERPAGKTTSGQQTVIKDDIFHLGGGGASVLGNGGGYDSNYKYDTSTDQVTYNVSEASYGGGGCGGICHLGIYRTQTTSGYKGGDGCALVWWPQTPSGWKDFVYFPSFTQSIVAGEYYVEIENSNTFSTTLRYEIKRDETAKDHGWEDYTGETTIAAGAAVQIEDAYGPELLEGDEITAVFVSDINASQESTFTVSSDPQS